MTPTQLKKRIKLGGIFILSFPLLVFSLSWVITWVTSDFFPALKEPSSNEYEPNPHVGYLPEGLVREEDEEPKYIIVTTDEVLYYVGGEPVYKTIIKEEE
jgi:hypothetical protein